VSFWASIPYSIAEIKRHIVVPNSKGSYMGLIIDIVEYYFPHAPPITGWLTASAATIFIKLIGVSGGFQRLNDAISNSTMN